MVVNESGKFLNVSTSTFKGREGDEVTFYRMGFIPASDNVPLELVCTKDVYDAGQYIDAYDDVQVAIEVTSRSGRVKVRVTFLGIAA